MCVNGVYKCIEILVLKNKTNKKQICAVHELSTIIILLLIKIKWELTKNNKKTKWKKLLLTKRSTNSTQTTTRQNVIMFKVRMLKPRRSFKNLLQISTLVCDIYKCHTATEKHNNRQHDYSVLWQDGWRNKDVIFTTQPLQQLWVKCFKGLRSFIYTDLGVQPATTRKKKKKKKKA